MEAKKFRPDFKSFIMLQNYKIDECSHDCRESKGCDSFLYSVDMDEESENGCWLYYKADNEPRTTTVDAKTEIFCDKTPKPGIILVSSIKKSDIGF